MIREILLSSAILAGFANQPAEAHGNKVATTTKGSETCITSNGTPNHDIGQFPNRGNPNRFKAQNLEYCFDATPELTGRTNHRAQTVGVTLTGIAIRPGTADYYDAKSPRGFSRDRSSGWRLEGMGAAEILGMDAENAHVDNRGLYHYHAISDALVDSLHDSHIGYAADGFEIHYVGDQAQSSWQLKSGSRPTPPRGEYDGTYEQDWEFIAGSGTLDECNGAMVDGTYTYFATDTFPFFPRCFKGTVSSDFTPRR